MLIIGAGLSGLLAANMLFRRQPHIIERQSSLPNNHSAVLRFRTSIVGDVVGIPFKSVNMIKANAPWRNVVADALSYSYKNLGMSLSDRSISADIKIEQRFIAPTDLISRMATGLKISFDSSFDGLQSNFSPTHDHKNNEPTISPFCRTRSETKYTPATFLQR